jgi:uncharacterized protein with FMN-binding domain
VARAGGKGKVSNDLVAVSCAAVLSVYTAGYWRTRDEARRIETRAQERRLPLTERSAAAGTKSVDIEATAPLRQPPSETSVTLAPVTGVAAPSATAVAAKAPSTAPVAAPVPSPASPQGMAALPVEGSVEAVTASSANGPAPATASAATPESAPVPVGYWRDGTYTGWGTSRHGDIKAQVVIRNGRIVESSIASCETRYPCDVISEIINQPVARQNPEVDRVSRATESADAYYYGLVEALGEALIQPATQATAPK